jgi:hypothetical protein
VLNASPTVFNCKPLQVSTDLRTDWLDTPGVNGSQPAGFIHHLVAANTADELVMARRESKRDVQDLLLEAMTRIMK